MNKLERVLATLHHENPDVVPQQEVFFDDTSEQKFMPILRERLNARHLDAPTDERMRRHWEYTEVFDNYLLGVGGGGLRAKVVEQGDNYHILEWENTCRWRIREYPFNRQYIYMPIQSEADLESMPMPDPHDPARYEGVAESIQYFTARGYFTMAGVGGPFADVWYHYRKYEDLMMDMALRPDFAQKLIWKVADYNLAAAEEFLKRGVHCILSGSDMGSSTNSFFSPEYYRRFYFEPQKRLCDLAHQYGAYTNFHSHGNINALMPLIAETGIDMLNPVGPSDNMNLAELKERYGHQITLIGGISHWLAELSYAELDQHIEEVVRTGSRGGGGYMACNEGGVIYTMEPEKVIWYLDTVLKYREKYGAA
jgi:uroporphyrinogen decarboxylase